MKNSYDRIDSTDKTRFMNFTFHSFNYLFFALYTFICFYPFYYIIMVSFSNTIAVSRGDVVFWPVEPTLRYFRDVFEVRGIFNSFLISLSRTILGTAITLFFSTMLAYILTKEQFRFRKIVYRMTIVTMYASGGLIPYVITMTMYGLRNNFLLYILPTAISAFYVVILKTYIEQQPAAIEESAIVDGAGYFTILTQIIFPLAKPAIAAVAVFSAVGQWNTFTDNLFLVSDRNLTTMQLILFQYLQGAQAMSANAREMVSMITTKVLPPPNAFTLKTTLAVVTIVPILIAYPLLQRHFVHGIMLGAVKG